jgi:hypothetical protein
MNQPTTTTFDERRLGKALRHWSGLGDDYYGNPDGGFEYGEDLRFEIYATDGAGRFTLYIMLLKNNKTALIEFAALTVFPTEEEVRDETAKESAPLSFDLDRVTETYRNLISVFRED